MKKVLLLAVFIISEFYFSQNKDFKSIITVSTFAPFRDQRYNVGYMYELDNHWWVGAELAYGNSRITPPGPTYFVGENRAFEIRPEVFYSLAPQSALKHFVSAEVFYLNQTGKSFSGNYYDENNHYYSFSSADYKRTKYGLNINYGILLTKKTSWFGFMPKIGFGIRQRNISFSNIENLAEGAEPTDGPPFDFRLNREGSDLGFNFNIDMKIVFKF